MNNLFTYTNGWGHLIITIFFGILGALFVLLPTTDAATKGIGIALITTASGAWLIPGAAKQVASDVAKVKSPQGVQGEQGLPGVQGEQGEQGLPGPQGESTK